MWLFRGKGPSGFSSSSTAEDVTQGVDATGLTAIVTGGSSGIGAETARVLALRGAHVVIAVRNMAAGKETKEAIVKQIGIGEKIRIGFQPNWSPAKLIDAFYVNDTVSIVISFVVSNNAGVMAIPFKLSKDNIELQFATNHVGHFLLTHLLLDTMKKTARESKNEGRIVNVASEAHRRTYAEGIRFDKINDESGYSRFRAYGQSKLANILHATELTKHLKDEGVDITANALHPGVVATNLFRHFTVLTGVVDKIGKIIMKDVHQGAATTCYVALHPQVKGVSGEYFSDSNLAKPTRQATDANLAKKLWDFSINLLN